MLCVLTTAAGNGQPGNDLIRYEATAGTSSGAPSTSQVTPSGTPIAAAAFAAGSNVVAAGNAGVTALSADAGKTFTPVGSKLPGSFSGVVAGPAKTAFAYGDNGAIAKTVNGGVIMGAGQRPDVGDAAAASPSRRPAPGFALDVSGGLFATADAGATWRTLDIGTTATPRSVLAPSRDDRLRGRPAQRAALGRRRHVVHRGDGQDRQEVGQPARRRRLGDLRLGRRLALAHDRQGHARGRRVKYPTRIVKLRSGKKVNAFFIDQRRLREREDRLPRG